MLRLGRVGRLDPDVARRQVDPQAGRLRRAERLAPHRRAPSRMLCERARAGLGPRVARVDAPVAQVSERCREIRISLLSALGVPGQAAAGTTDGGGRGRGTAERADDPRVDGHALARRGGLDARLERLGQPQRDAGAGVVLAPRRATAPTAPRRRRRATAPARRAGPRRGRTGAAPRPRGRPRRAGREGGGRPRPGGSGSAAARHRRRPRRRARPWPPDRRAGHRRTVWFA